MDSALDAIVCMAGIPVPRDDAHGGVVLTYVNVSGSAQIFPARDWQKQVFFEANKAELYVQPQKVNRFNDMGQSNMTGLLCMDFLLANKIWRVKYVGDPDFTTWRVGSYSLTSGWSPGDGKPPKYFDKILLDVDHGTSTYMTWVPTRYAVNIPWIINKDMISRAYKRSFRDGKQWPLMKETPSEEIVIRTSGAGTHMETLLF